MTATAPFNMFYVDDSGSNETGLMVYSWLEVSPASWGPVLRRWLDYRKEVVRDFQIPITTEIHSTKFMGGRSRPSNNEQVNDSKAALALVVKRALEAMADCPELRIGTVWRRVAAGKGFGAKKEAFYADFVAYLEQRFAAAGEHGLIFMDGDGTDLSYLRAHRNLKLADRRLIEDPIFHASHASQPVQMADVIAWTANQALLKHPGKKRCWGWYDKYLQAADVNGGPVQI
ncbi:hypothetical protein GCM10009789_82930 [Kribbella sancticallisti]|uniref:DUF3800 domain-containing protein n=1 Tax=Kribbella sancticallisti TaxID=460087 RepID=A0ABN2ETV1_9ACTN